MIRKGTPCQCGGYDYLPSDNLAAAAAKEKARKNILAMANRQFPLNPIDADEPEDPLTQGGFSADNLDCLVPVDPEVCLGIMCWKPSYACDECTASGKKDQPWGGDWAEVPVDMNQGGSSPEEDFEPFPEPSSDPLPPFDEAVSTGDKYDEVDTRIAPLARGARARLIR